MSDTIRVGVSACLLGAPVRFDGGHKHSSIVELLGKFVELVSVCPEVEVGLGTPRESLRLVRRGERDVSLVAPRSQRDLTGVMHRYAVEKAKQIAGWGLSGFVVKKDSPSCGMERVRVYDHNGIPARTGVGLFTAELIAQNPLLPVEEEGRLQDPRLRDNFIVRVFAHHALDELFHEGWRLGELVDFHSRSKLLLLAHEPASYQALGRLVARARQVPRDELATQYREQFSKALATVPGRARHVNVLQHLAGYFKRTAAEAERRELAELIADYRNELVPLSVPLAVIRHHVLRNEVRYLAQQTYLRPYPKELGVTP